MSFENAYHPNRITRSVSSTGEEEASSSGAGGGSLWNWDYPTTPENYNSLMERGRSRNWTHEETMELINKYTSDEWQAKFHHEKKNHRNIWSNLAGSLTKRRDISGDEARQKLNNLKAFYNRLRRQLISREISYPNWEYWTPLHTFLHRTQPNYRLPPPETTCFTNEMRLSESTSCHFASANNNFSPRLLLHQSP